MATQKVWKGDVPFELHGTYDPKLGSKVPYTIQQVGRIYGYTRHDKSLVWVPNFVFETVLTYRSRQADHSFSFMTREGAQVIFLTEHFTNLVPHMVRGQIEGTFTFTKKGADNYSCRLLEAASPF